MEVGILKFLVLAAILLVTRFILECIRYSDNLLYSFKTKKEYLEVKQDLEKSFEKYSMKLKYCITSQEHDSAVLKHPVRGAEVLERHWVFIGLYLMTP